MGLPFFVVQEITQPSEIYRKGRLQKKILKFFKNFLCPPLD